MASGNAFAEPKFVVQYKCTAMENVSMLINVLFGVTAIAAVLLFWKATNYSKSVIIVLSIWILLQSILGLRGFYTNWSATPPRFPMLIIPPALLIVVLFILKKGRSFIDSLNLETLTILHAIRIPVEICLYYLFIAKLIPRAMTFEGSNFDLLSGISAPFVYYFAFVVKRMDWKFLLGWNIICLGLLLNVVMTAFLSAKTPFQQLAFDQPNIGVTYFPYVLLPAVIVPIVLFSHLAGLRQILRKETRIALAH
jgi:hypothetical protein